MNAERGMRNADWDADAPYALCANPRLQTPDASPQSGFTLLEVMIAMFVFFIVVFAVLGMVVQSLGAARALQRPQPDFGILASMLTLSNVLEPGCESGDFSELPEYKDYDWERCIVPAIPTDVEGTNNFWRVRFVITRRGAGSGGAVEEMELLMHRPNAAGAAGGRRRLQ